MTDPNPEVVLDEKARHRAHEAFWVGGKTAGRPFPSRQRGPAIKHRIDAAIRAYLSAAPAVPPSGVEGVTIEQFHGGWKATSVLRSFIQGFYDEGDNRHYIRDVSLPRGKQVLWSESGEDYDSLHQRMMERIELEQFRTALRAVKPSPTYRDALEAAARLVEQRAGLLTDRQELAAEIRALSPAPAVEPGDDVTPEAVETLRKAAARTMNVEEWEGITPVSPPHGGEWRTMESAPKDGTLVHLWFSDKRPPHQLQVMSWRTKDVAFQDEPLTTWWNRYGLRSEHEPTHWHPLPPPPSVPVPAEA